jgi:hypothetical protein
VLPELAALLDDVEAFVRRFVVLSADQAIAVVLWVAHTHAMSAADCTPYLDISSAEKESGKTQLLEVLDLLVARPWLTGRVTAAVLGRKIDKEHPTLLLDESDAAFGGPSEYAEVLRGILNTGYRRSGKTSVCVGQGANINYVDLSTFCPKAIAGLGEKLPDTVRSRSIRIRLKKRLSRERIERFRRRDVEAAAEPVQVSLASMLEHIAPHLMEARPTLPEALSDRAADVWEPLLAIADLAGGDWPARARRAALALSGGNTSEDESVGIRLLADIRRAYGEFDTERLSSKQLLAFLNELEDAPWGEWQAGKPLTAIGLAKLLKPYDVRPRSIRLDDGTTAKGYLLEQFDDPFSRYLSALNPPVSVTPSQGASLSQEHAISIRHTTPLVTDSEAASNPHGYVDVTGVTAETAGKGSGAENGRADPSPVPLANSSAPPTPACLPSLANSFIPTSSPTDDNTGSSPSRRDNIGARCTRRSLSWTAGLRARRRRDRAAFAPVACRVGRRDRRRRGRTVGRDQDV